MSTQETDRKRRQFLRTAVAGAIAAPVVGLLGPEARAANEKLKLDDPQAKALQYVHNYKKAQDNPAHQEGAHCANCMHWTGGSSEWGGCNIFPGKLVHQQGWCTAWAKQG